MLRDNFPTHYKIVSKITFEKWYMFYKILMLKQIKIVIEI